MRLVLQNFRSHDSLDVTFDDVNEVVGRNGSGKTSILEAILFALYGRDFYGSTGADRCIQSGKDDATVMLAVDNNEIKRILTKKGTEIYLNGGKSTQAEIETKFGSMSFAMPILNPFYFMQMSDGDKRDLFMKLLPAGDRREIFIKKYGEDLVDKFMLYSEPQAKKQLKEMTQAISNNDLTVSQLHEQIKTDKAEIRIHSQNLLPEEKLVEDSGNDIDEIAKEYDSLREKLIRFGDLDEESDKLKGELEGVVSSAKELLQRYGGSSLGDSLKEHEEMRDRLIKKQSDLAKDLTAIDTSINIFTSSIRNGICNVCGQKATSEHMHGRQEDLEKQKEELVEKLKQFDVAIEKEKVAYDELSNLQDTGQRVQSRLAEINAVFDEYTQAKVRATDLKDMLEKARDAKPENENEIRLHNEATSKIEVLNDRIANAEKKIQSMEKQTEQLKPQIEELKVIVEALGSKGVNSEIIKAQTKQLEKLMSKYLEGITIETIRENKTNEGYKEVFDVFVNGVDFKSLSFGETLKLSMAFGLVIRGLIDDFKLPFVLLDEASVISDAPMKQITNWCKKSKLTLIYTKVSNGKFAVKPTKHE